MGGETLFLPKYKKIAFPRIVIRDKDKSLRCQPELPATDADHSFDMPQGPIRPPSRCRALTCRGSLYA